MELRQSCSALILIGAMACTAEPPAQTPVLATSEVLTPYGPQTLTYEVVDGYGIFDGDIILGRIEDLGGVTQGEVGVKRQALRAAGATKVKLGRKWPQGVVPYVITPAITDAPNIYSAMAIWESKTSIRFVPRTTETDYISFAVNPAGNCSSSIGRVGGIQQIWTPGTCSTRNYAHEIGHALGMFHEQARADRDDYVTIHWSEIIPTGYSNFLKFGTGGSDGRSRTPYDYDSVMHSRAYVWSHSGNPTITKIDGTIMPDTPTVSDLDACAIQRYYGFGQGSDFNGDGYADFIAGVAYEEVGGLYNAGAINVAYGSASGISTTAASVFHRNTSGVFGSAESDAHFGASIAVGDFNGDCFDDVAVGVPDDDIGSHTDAGSVHLFYGSASGLGTAGNSIFSLDRTGMPIPASSGDRFGSRLVAGDFDGNGYSDLAVGAYDSDVSTIVDAGQVIVLYGSSAGISTTGSQVWNQNITGVLDTAATSDRFGYALAAGDVHGDGFDELIIGIPYEDINGHDDAGAVAVLMGSEDGVTADGNLFLHEDRAELPDEAEDGDLFGRAVVIGDFDGNGERDLAIGVPHETINGEDEAGAVVVIYGYSDSSGLDLGTSERLHQDVTDIDGAAEEGDEFGFSLASGDFDSDGREDLAVGIPFEDISSTPTAGAVAVIYRSASGLDAAGDQFWSQDSAGISGGSETSDMMGGALTVADFNGDTHPDLAISAYFEDVNGFVDAGAVNVIYGGNPKLSSTGNQMLTQDTLETLGAHDYFGVALP